MPTKTKYALGGLLAIAIFSALPVSAQNTRVSSSGHEYQVSCNTNGIVLSSLYPVARTVRTSSGQQTIRGREKVYLGKICDSFSPVLGNGRWCWGNGGVMIELEAGGIGFPRQDLDCANGADVGLQCRC